MTKVCCAVSCHWRRRVDERCLSAAAAAAALTAHWEQLLLQLTVTLHWMHRATDMDDDCAGWRTLLQRTTVEPLMSIDQSTI